MECANSMAKKRLKRDSIVPGRKLKKKGTEYKHKQRYAPEVLSVVGVMHCFKF